MTQAEIGLIGLGTMGAMLALNIAEKGFPVAVWNRTTSVTHGFLAGAGDLAPRIIATESLAALVAAIKPPRRIILMVPAGPAVDDQIAALRPLLGKILVPEITSNLCFGGRARHQLYITAFSSLYAITLNRSGAQRP